MCVRLTYYHRYLEGTVSVLKDFRSYLYGALRPGNRTGEFLWYVYVKGAKFGNLPNKLLDNALWDDEDAEPAVPSEEDLDAPPERASVSQNALIEAEGGGVNYVILDDDDVVVAPDANPLTVRTRTRTRSTCFFLGRYRRMLRPGRPWRTLYSRR